jgi:hypothetical protein
MKRLGFPEKDKFIFCCMLLYSSKKHSFSQTEHANSRVLAELNMKTFEYVDEVLFSLALKTIEREDTNNNALGKSREWPPRDHYKDRRASSTLLALLLGHPFKLSCAPNQHSLSSS